MNEINKRNTERKKKFLLLGGCIVLILIVVALIRNAKNPEELNLAANINVNISNGAHIAQDGE